MKEDKRELAEEGWNRRKFLRRLSSGVGLAIVGVSAWELSGCQTDLAPREGDGASSNDGGGQRERVDGGSERHVDTLADKRAAEPTGRPDSAEQVADAVAQDTAVPDATVSDDVNDAGVQEFPTEPTPEIPSHEEPVFEAPPEPRACHPTEDNIEGPFYRTNAPWVTQLAPPNEPGTPLLIEGIVFGPDCRTPLANITVDVWQANNKGSYDNDGQNDPGGGVYHLRGRMRTNAKGQYKYTTIMPGRYLNGNVFRPAHIHYKVYGPGVKTLTTQLYFAGDPYLKGDPFVRPGLIIPTQSNGKGLRGTFHIVLTR